MTKEDKACICKGNWRTIVTETEHLIGKRFSDGQHVWTFFGIVHGSDDYYYGMHRNGKLLLRSCVGALEEHGWSLMDR